MDDLTLQIQSFLRMAYQYKGANDTTSTPMLFSLYVHLLNTLYERMRAIFKFLQYNAGEQYKTFGIARKWANFFKHPKALSYMAHHPEYKFETIPLIPNLEGEYSLIVNYRFVKKYFSEQDEKLENQLRETLKLKGDRVLVLFPNLEDLTLKICEEIKQFVRFLTENPQYIDYLKQDEILKPI